MSKHLLSRQIFALLTVLSLLTVPASARQQLHGHVPQEANASSYLGAMDTAATLNLAIGLPLQNEGDLQQFLKEVYDQHSPLYHHFLTPEQFAQQYGPVDSDYQAVVDFAKTHNLTVTNTYSNHLVVDVQGSVSDIQKTFHVNLNRYRRQDGSEFHAPDQEPSLDLDVEVAHVSGLENYHVPKPSFSMVKMDESTASPQNLFSAKPNSGTGTGGLYLGGDFRNAYFPSCSSISSLEGAGQTVALVEFDGYTSSDITAYKNDTGYSESQLLTNILLDSVNGAPGSDNGEVALDIEMIFAMAPQAQIEVVEGQLGNDILSQIATLPRGHLANQISCSWTFSDGPGADHTTAGLIQEFATQGQSYFQSSGDSGSYVGSNTVPGPIDLTSEMTVVGGTQLTTGPGATYTSETTWNDSFGEGGGGICNSSTPVPIPTYQDTATFITGSNDASAANRNIPDVSMVAANIESIATTVIHGVTTTGVIFSTYGTSCAAPLWAGFTTLINEQAQSEVKGPMGLLNPYLYNLASNATTYGNDFNDIKDSSNNNASGSGLYPAVNGYDLATGLGSPKCALLTDIVAPLSTNTITPTPTITNTPNITPTPTATPTITNTPTPPSTNSSYAYPQPAHGGQVYLVYNSPIAQQVRINIYSLSGQEVDSVMDTPQASNANRVLISLQGFVPSVYFYVINGLSSGTIAKGKFLVIP